MTRNSTMHCLVILTLLLNQGQLFAAAHVEPNQTDATANGPGECEVETQIVGTNSAFYFELSDETGSATAVSTLGLGGLRDVSGLAFDRNTNTLYCVDIHSDQLFIIDAATSARTPVGALRFSEVNSLAFDPYSNTLYGTKSDDLLIIDTVSGVGTVVGPAHYFDITGLALITKDCNNNGIADACDIDEGTSEDVDENGVPDECESCIDDLECDDGLFCNGVEQCEPASGCFASTNPCPDHPRCDETDDACVDCLIVGHCNDGVGCTVDVCEPGGVCSNTLDDAGCDDGLFCTGDEICDPGDPEAGADGCVATGDPCFNDCLMCNDTEDACEPVIVMAAQSCLIHDRAGDCEELLCIDLAESNGVEPRQSGPHMFKFAFSDGLNALTVQPDNVQIACASGSPPAVISVSQEGANVLIVETSVFVDQDCCNITFNAMRTQTGLPICIAYEIAPLRGDINFDRAVTGADALLIKPHFGESICEGTLAHPKWDYNLDGAVTGADFALVKPLFGHLALDCDPAMPCECP